MEIVRSRIVLIGVKTKHVTFETSLKHVVVSPSQNTKVNTKRLSSKGPFKSNELLINIVLFP